MTTNLIHRKGLLGATVYHLPTGEVNILVFNYFRTPKGENGHWGAELKAYLEPGRKYILRPKELAASSSHSGKLYALVVLEDESGNNVVRDYSFFTPLDQIGMKSISYDTTYYDEMDDKHKSLTGAIGMTIGSEMGLFIDEWNLFVQDVKAGKYD